MNKATQQSTIPAQKACSSQKFGVTIRLSTIPQRLRSLPATRRATPLNANPYQPSSMPNDPKRSIRWPLTVPFALAVGLPLMVEFTVLLAAGRLGHFFWLFQQAAQFLIVAWPISLPIAICLFYAHRTTSEAGQLKSRQLLWLAPLIVIPFAMLAWGAVFEHPRGRGFVRWHLTVVHWMFFTSIAIGMLAVTVNRGRRALVAASTVLLLLFSFSCSFTAGSAVTGDWL